MPSRALRLKLSARAVRRSVSGSLAGAAALLVGLSGGQGAGEELPVLLAETLRDGETSEALGDR
jgi:hypothetical protein